MRKTTYNKIIGIQDRLTKLSHLLQDIRLQPDVTVDDAADLQEARNAIAVATCSISGVILAACAAQNKKA